MKPFSYAMATTRAAALSAAGRGYKPKGSGVDLIDLLKERIEPAEKFVSLEGVDEFRGTALRNGQLVIGALATLREIAASAEVAGYLPILARCAAETATPQIRARATAAGNILQRPRCWYFRSHDYDCLKKGGATCYAREGENTYHALFGPGPCVMVHASSLAPVLAAAGALVRVATATTGRDIPADEFFQLPDKNLRGENVLAADEVVSEIVIPRKPAKSGYVELREKQSFDWPLASAAVVHDGKGWSVVLGHVAPAPWRAKAAEAVLAGAGEVDAALAEKAADAALEGAAPLAQNAWRLKLVRAAVRRALLAACGKDPLA